MDPAINTRQSPSSQPSMTSGLLQAVPWMSLFGALVAAIFSIAVAGFIETRLIDFASEEVGSRAIQQIQANLATAVTEADVEPPFGAEKIEDIARRIDPAVGRLLGGPSGVLSLQIYARDGTVIYSNNLARRGQKVGSPRIPRLAAALGGSVVTRLIAISSVEESELGDRYGEVLDIFGPMILDGKVLAAYEVYQDPSPLRMVRTVAWATVVGFVTALFLLYDRRRQIQTQRRMEVLAEAKALRNLDRLKTEMMSTVAHELRTPLSLVHGYAELLGSTTREFRQERVQEMAREIYRGSGTMNRIVEDLLDFGRIEQGHMSLKIEPADLRRVVDESVQLFAMHPEFERIVLENTESPMVAQIDSDRLKQVIGNLVTNALRYAPTGPVRVRLGSDTPGQALIEVSDEGPGIPPDVLPRVWEMFYRAPSTAGSTVRGAGVGLSLVRNLVEAHNGTVEALSTPGKGSTFRVRLPVENEAHVVASN